MWVKKLGKSFIRNQIYDLIKQSQYILEKEEFDLEQLLIFDNMIYHLHKFIDSSLTIKEEFDENTKIYYYFSQKYRD